MRTLSNISNSFTLTDYSEMYLANDGSFMRESKVYTAEQYKAYLETLKQRNERLKAAGLPEENVLTVIYQRDERNVPIIE